jgi:hypothetical protein
MGDTDQDSNTNLDGEHVHIHKEAFHALAVTNNLNENDDAGKLLHENDDSPSHDIVPDEWGKPSFFERRAIGMANRPCLHLLTALGMAIALSAFGIIVGEFSIAAENGGWESRGTLIADRQSQVLLIDSNRDKLFYGDSDVWDDLQNNIQKRLRARVRVSDDSNMRQLTEEPLTTTSSLLTSRARDIIMSKGHIDRDYALSFPLNQQGKSRNLQALNECKTDWYVQMFTSLSIYACTFFCATCQEGFGS